MENSKWTRVRIGAGLDDAAFTRKLVEPAPKPVRPRTVAQALAEVYDLNGQGTLLSEYGVDFEHVSRHPFVSGYELAHRIRLAQRRMNALQIGIEGCIKLLEGEQA